MFCEGFSEYWSTTAIGLDKINSGLTPDLRKNVQDDAQLAHNFKKLYGTLYIHDTEVIQLPQDMEKLTLNAILYVFCSEIVSKPYLKELPKNN